MPVRWGFIGAGGIARVLAAAVHAADGAVLAAVASRDPVRSRALEPQRVHATYSDLVEDPAIDAVYISLSNDAHAPWATAALDASKHVLCEKPLALDTAEVDELIAASQRAGRLLVEASMWRWHPRTQRLAELIASGAVGAVRHVEAGFTFSGDLTGNYRNDPARGGGALYDVGCYALSAVLVALGSCPVVDVQARSLLAASGVDLTTEAVLDFADETGASTASVRASVAEPERQWLVVTGERGELECRHPVFTAYTSDVAELLVSDGRSTVVERFGPVDPYRLMVEAVSRRATGDGEAWVLPSAQTRRGAELLDSIRAATIEASAG